MFDRVLLKEVAERVDYGITTSAVIDGSGPRFLRITDIDGSFVDWQNVPRCSISETEASKYGLSTGDIVVARTGASTGRSQWVQVTEPAVFASYLVRFRVGPMYDSRFIGYVLNSLPWHDHVASVAHGKSAQPNMSASEMARFEFAAPPLAQQTAIAEVLGALDDKIAANSKLIAGLEALSESVFLGMVKQSRIIPLSQTAQFVNGKAFTKGASGTGRVVIRIAELNSGLGASTVYSDAEVDEQYVADPGDLLFAWSGSLTVQRWFRPTGIINQHIFKVIPKDGFPMWLVAQALRRKLAFFQATAADKATTMGHIQRKHLDELVDVPNQAEIDSHAELMTSLWNRALLAEQESLSLSTTRDTLLPQLMSGKLRVKDVERSTEATL